MNECDNLLAGKEWTLPARWVTVLVAAALVLAASVSGGYSLRTGSDQASTRPMPENTAMQMNAARNAEPISVATTAR